MEKTPKYEIVNDKWIKSNIDIDECIKRTKETESYVFAIELDAVKSIEIIISTGLVEMYGICLHVGYKDGLAFHYTERDEFENDLNFFQKLLFNRKARLKTLFKTQLYSLFKQFSIFA